MYEVENKHTRNIGKKGHAVDNLLARLSRIKVPSGELKIVKQLYTLRNVGVLIHKYRSNG